MSAPAPAASRPLRAHRRHVAFKQPRRAQTALSQRLSQLKRSAVPGAQPQRPPERTQGPWMGERFCRKRPGIRVRSRAGRQGDLAPRQQHRVARHDRRPVPARERGWLELSGQDGSAARLVPSAYPYTRVSRLAPVPDSPAARELSQQGLGLIGLQLTGAGQDAVERQCSAALARAAEIQQSGGPGVAGELPGHLAPRSPATRAGRPHDLHRGGRTRRGLTVRMYGTRPLYWPRLVRTSALTNCKPKGQRGVLPANPRS